MATDVTYSSVDWQSGSGGGTPMSAANMNVMEDGIEGLVTQFNSHNGGNATSDHPLATASAHGFASSTQISKLDGIETGAKADLTAAEILTLIKTVDGAGSGLDADLLDGVTSANFARSNTTDTVTTLRFANGTEANPSQSFSSSTNMGWRRVSSAQLGASVSGSNAMLVSGTRINVEELAWLDGSDVFVIGDISGARVYVGTGNANKFFCGLATWAPNLDDSYDLGHPSYRYDDVFATNATIQTSDRRTKKALAALDDARSLALVRAIEPIEFKFKKGKRPHYSFDADQVGDTLAALGIDFGGYVDPSYSQLTKDGMVPTGQVKGRHGKHMKLKAPDAAPLKGLRMGEFHPVLWSATQQILARLEALEA